MALRLIVVAAVLAASQAKPFWFAENGIIPGTVIFREARAPEFAPPSIAYGFGSGFSSNIGGIRHSSSIGSSFETGGGQAYGAGISGSDGNVFARGVGYANANPAPTVYRAAYPVSYTPYNAFRRTYPNNYGAAVSSAQNSGAFGSSVAHSHNSPYGSSATAVQNGGQYQSAVSSAQNLRGLGYGSTVSTSSSGRFGSAATSSADGYGTAISSAQTLDGSGFKAAVSASENVGGVRASTAQTVQQNGGSVQHSGATSIDGPGIQTSHAHAVDTGNGYY